LDFQLGSTHVAVGFVNLGMFLAAELQSLESPESSASEYPSSADN